MSAWKNGSNIIRHKPMKMPIKISAAEEAAKKRISQKLKPVIDKNLDQMIKEINKRTYIYSALFAFGLFLVFAPLPEILFYILCGLMTAALFYLLWNFIKTSRKVLYWMDNFENLLKKTVKNEVQKHKESLGFWEDIGFGLSGLSERDIEDFCVSCAVRELARRFKRKKWHLLARIGAFAAALMFLQKAVTEILRIIF